MRCAIAGSRRSTSSSPMAGLLVREARRTCRASAKKRRRPVSDMGYRRGRPANRGGSSARRRDVRSRRPERGRPTCRRAGLPRLSQKRAPRKRPPQTRLREAYRPLPQVLLPGQVCQTLAIQSLRARDSAAEPERRFLLCAHNAHLWPWSTLEHSSPIEDACTSSWESHRWVLRRGFSSSRTSRADASVVSNGPTRDLTPARDGLVIARTQPTSRRATNEESTPASADVLTVRLTASQSSPVTSNEQM